MSSVVSTKKLNTLFTCSDHFFRSPSSILIESLLSFAQIIGLLVLLYVPASCLKSLIRYVDLMFVGLGNLYLVSFDDEQRSLASKKGFRLI